MLPQAPWRRFQFRLRTLLIVVTVLAVGLAIHHQGARRQQAAVQTVIDAGGLVAFDDSECLLNEDCNNSLWHNYRCSEYSVTFVSGARPYLRYPRNAIGSPAGPAWYPDPSGDQMIPLSDDVVKAIGTLPGIEYLDLASTNVDDDDLQHLSGLNNLSTLQLGNRVSQAGVDRLRLALPWAFIYF
ncbi:MAG: hypothetical protein RIC55_07135 [Pirellulaceae bacterium]